MASNVGTQTISILYNAQALSGTVNNRHLDIRKTGIYSGGYLTKVSDTSVSLSALVCEITDGTYQIKAQTAAVVTVTVAVAIPYVVLRWVYVADVSDFYMSILAVAAPTSNDLVVGKCVFAGSTLTGFVYTERTSPNVQDLFLKVEATPTSELKVRIRAGRIRGASANFDINDQLSSLFVVPASNSRVDLVYINQVTGAVAIDSSGTVAASPTAPSYGNKLVLAEITIASSSVDITASMIKDVRNFITSVSAYTPAVYAGQESRTASDGQIRKTGFVSRITSADNVVVFAVPFPIAIEHVFLSVRDNGGNVTTLHYFNHTVAGFTIGAGSLTGADIHWEAVGR